MSLLARHISATRRGTPRMHLTRTIPKLAKLASVINTSKWCVKRERPLPPEEMSVTDGSPTWVIYTKEP